MKVLSDKPVLGNKAKANSRGEQRLLGSFSAEIGKHRPLQRYCTLIYLETITQKESENKNSTYINCKLLKGNVDWSSRRTNAVCIMYPSITYRYPSSILTSSQAGTSGKC